MTKLLIEKYPRDAISGLASIKAMADGKATEGQQKMAFNLISLICGTYSMNMPSADKDALLVAFDEGRRTVGLELRRIVQTPMEQLVTEKPDDDSDGTRRNTVSSTAKRIIRRSAAGR